MLPMEFLDFPFNYDRGRYQNYEGRFAPVLSISSSRENRIIAKTFQFALPGGNTVKIISSNSMPIDEAKTRRFCAYLNFQGDFTG